jgi:hypothetical protein
MDEMPWQIIGTAHERMPWQHRTCKTYGCEFELRRLHVYPDWPEGGAALIWHDTWCVGCGVSHWTEETHSPSHWRAVVSYPSH